MQLFGRLPLEDFKALSISTKDFFAENLFANFVIIGASGFLGRWVTTYFKFMQINGDFLGTLSLIVRDPTKLSEFRDMGSSALQRIIPTQNLDSKSFSHLNANRIVVIFAATSTLTENSKLDSKNNKGINLAEKVVSLLPSGNITFVHLSSGGIYQREARGLDAIPREYKTQTQSSDPYINEKITLENWSRSQGELGRFTARNPRLFSFYGPGLPLDRHFAIGEFMNRARAGLPVLITGNPANKRSYLYPTDAILQLLPQCQIQNPVHTQLGSGNPMTILSASETIAKEFDVPLVISGNPTLTLNNYVPMDIPRTAEKSFDQGINDWASWLVTSGFN
jgi:dTDP-glucose 4,6-dehydratase